MSDTFVTAIQAVVVALLILFGQIAVARLSKRAQTEATESGVQEKATRAWQEYAEKMEGRLERTEGRLAEVEGREADTRRRIAALERQSEADMDLIRRLLGRLRKALSEISRLGGVVSDADLEVADLAEARLRLPRAR